MTDRDVLMKPKVVLFAHLEIHYRNGPEQYLVEHAGISLGDSLCLHDYYMIT